MTPQLFTANGAVFWQSGMVVDADGAPNSYAPAGSGLAGLDYLANAMDGDKFVGVVCVNDEPVIQGPGDPAPGFYVSPTSLCDRNKSIVDPARYVNASSVPYLAICPELRSAYGVSFGDLAMVLYFGRLIGAICADGAPHNHYGEASIACARALGIPPSPKNGGTSVGVTFIVFPHTASTPAWPRDLDDIQARAAQLFASFGGVNAVPWLAPAA